MNVICQTHCSEGTAWTQSVPRITVVCVSRTMQHAKLQEQRDTNDVKSTPTVRRWRTAAGLVRALATSLAAYTGNFVGPGRMHAGKIARKELIQPYEAGVA